MCASVFAAVSGASARFSITPAVPNGMVRDARPRMRMPCGSSSFAWPSNMAVMAIARLPHSCVSRAGMSTTRKSNACGAKKACRCQDATKHANDYMITSIPSFACVPCTRTTSGVWISSRTGCSGDAATGCSPSLMNIHVNVEPIYIYPGSPWENGYNERFNGTLRHEVMDTEAFYSLAEAQCVITQWIHQYNHIRPHQSLDHWPPVPETIVPGLSQTLVHTQGA